MRKTTSRLKVLLPAGETARLINVVQEQALEIFDNKPQLLGLPRTGSEICSRIARDWEIEGVDVWQAGLAKTDVTGQFRYGQMPLPEDIAGKEIMVVDGTCKSGEKLQHVVDLLQWAGASLVKSAVLLYKPLETTTGYKPDFIGETMTQGAYFVFPWEADEYFPQPPDMPIE